MRGGAWIIAILTGTASLVGEARAGNEKCGNIPDSKQVPVDPAAPPSGGSEDRIRDAMRSVPPCILNCKGTAPPVVFLPDATADGNAYYCPDAGTIYIPAGHLDERVRNESLSNGCGGAQAGAAESLEATVLHEAAHHMDVRCDGGSMFRRRKASTFLDLRYKKAYDCYQSNPEVQRKKDALKNAEPERVARNQAILAEREKMMQDTAAEAAKVHGAMTARIEVLSEDARARRRTEDDARAETQRIEGEASAVLRRIEEERYRRNQEIEDALERSEEEYQRTRCRLENELTALYNACGMPSRWPGDRHACDDAYGLEYYAMTIEIFAHQPGSFCAQFTAEEVRWLKKNLGPCLDKIPGPKPPCWHDPKEIATSVGKTIDSVHRGRSDPPCFELVPPPTRVDAP